MLSWICAASSRDQGARCASARGFQELKQGQHERGRLSRARLGAGQQVASGKHGGNRARLDGRRDVVAAFGQRGEQPGREPEIVEFHGDSEESGEVGRADYTGTHIPLQRATK
jgi:hypothetical protein